VFTASLNVAIFRGSPEEEAERGGTRLHRQNFCGNLSGNFFLI
jgi:hypothetical protein